MARLITNIKVEGERHQVVIVGAGIAGLTAAGTLAQFGVQALVLEKEPEVGGRCATVCDGNTRYDIGAQFFTVRRPEFRSLANSLLETGVAREWTRVFPDSSGVSEREGHPRYCGKAGMRSIAEALARELNVRAATGVKRIREGRACWVVELDNSKPVIADIVVFTPPVPVSLRLISDENTWRMGALLLPLAGIYYKPMVTVMAVLEGASGLPRPGAVRVDDDVVAWISDNQMKGISPGATAITIHGTQRFSEEHLSIPPDEAGALLLEAATPFIKSQVRAYRAHVWQHASPASTLLGAYYLVDARAPLFFAGDAFSGGLLEGAAISGMAVGKAVAARLKQQK